MWAWVSCMGCFWLSCSSIAGPPRGLGVQGVQAGPGMLTMFFVPEPGCAEIPTSLTPLRHWCGGRGGPWRSVGRGGLQQC